METVIAIVGILIYLAIGAFLCGAFGCGDDELLFACIWPIIVVLSLIFCIMEFLYELGEGFRK